MFKDFSMLLIKFETFSESIFKFCGIKFYKVLYEIMDYKNI